MRENDAGAIDCAFDAVGVCFVQRGASGNQRNQGSDGGGGTEVARPGSRTIVFVDEVHRFNKAQQDAFLPYVEAGHITFIGATTENPSFEVISPLLSRTKVYVLAALPTPLIAELLRRALSDKEHGLGNEEFEASDDVLMRIASFANGDARSAYNTLELAARSAIRDRNGVLAITPLLLEDILQRKMLRYDKSGEEHFNLISALHKSVRNSDPDAALYWLTRMLESGEDALVFGAAAGADGERRYWVGGAGRAGGDFGGEGCV